MNQIAYSLSVVIVVVICYEIMKVIRRKDSTLEFFSLKTMNLTGLIYVFIVVTLSSSIIGLTMDISGFTAEEVSPEYYEQVIETKEEGNQILRFINTNLSAPLREEFVLRGVVLPLFILLFLELKLSKKTSVVLAISIQAIIFGLLHGNMFQISFAIPVGIVFGFFMVKHKNILLNVFMHFLFNASPLTITATKNHTLVLVSLIMALVGTVYLVEFEGYLVFKSFKINKTILKTEE